MGIFGNFNKIVDSRAAGLIVFGVTGTAKVVSDYKNAPDNKKDFVLLRDSLILGGTALGVGAYSIAHGQIIKSPTVKNKTNKIKNTIVSSIKNSKIYNKLSAKITNPAEKIIKQTGKIIGDCADNTFMLASGILGAIAADYGIRATHLEKNRRTRKLARSSEDTIGSLYMYENKLINEFKNSRFNKDLDSAVGSEVKSNIYSRITDLPAMRMFSKTMVGMQGFEVIEEQTFKKRMKHATSCLISNSVIPLFFLSTATRLTKGMSTILRAPIIFTSLVGGTMYANKAIKHLEQTHDNNKKLT